MGNAWWSTELLRLQPSVAAYFRRRLAHGMAPEELASAVTREVVERIQDRATLPALWFVDGEPPEEVRKAFRRLVFRIAERRGLDALRRRYLELEASALSPATEKHLNIDAERQLDARRTLLTLLEELDALAPEDRELLLQEDSEDDFSDLDPVERIREKTRRRVKRHRLRRLLAERLARGHRK